MNQPARCVGRRSFSSKFHHLDRHTLHQLFYLDHCVVNINKQLSVMCLVGGRLLSSGPNVSSYRMQPAGDEDPVARRQSQAQRRLFQGLL